MEKKEYSKRNGRIKKTVWVLVVAAAVTIAVLMVLPVMDGGNEKVSFKEIDENKLPVSITSEVIPEYRTLERALACVADEDIYVLVTRGEKPTSGFGIAIDRLVLEEEKDRENLIVYAKFDDPDKETPISQIITYPMCVVKTDLTKLPDTIELRIQY